MYAVSAVRQPSARQGLDGPRRSPAAGHLTRRQQAYSVRMDGVDRSRLTQLIDRERRTYSGAHPRARALFEAAGHLLGRVPMTWMAKWSGGFPLYLERAWGNRI